MKAGKEKISIRQLILLFIMATFSPVIRLFPELTAKMAKQAGWLSPVVSMIGLLALVFIVQSFFKSGKYLNLSDVYYNILGKFLGHILVAIYFIYIIILQALYIRYYAERFLSSILPDTSIHFFIIVMLAFVFYVVRGEIVPFARYNELLFNVFIITFGITTFLALFNVKITNLLPVSYKDILPVAKSTYVILAIWGYFLFMFFIADKVNNKEQIKRLGIKTTFFLSAVSIMIIIATVGVLGSSLTTRTSLPYFISIKEISILNTVERLESIALVIWIVADFIVITVLTYISVSILKSLFHLSETKPFINPILLITYFLSLALAKNRFELEAFSLYVTLPVNVILCFGVPLIVFIVGKIRKLI